MENDNKALTVKQDNSVFEGKNYYCSVSLDNDQGQVLVYNALESCDVRVADSIGQTIELKDVYIEKYMKEKDGESKEAIRTILFDADGKSYVSTSFGIFNSIRRILNIFGEPKNWKEPKKVTFTERKLNDGKKSFVLKLAK